MRKDQRSDGEDWLLTIFNYSSVFLFTLISQGRGQLVMVPSTSFVPQVQFFLCFVLPSIKLLLILFGLCRYDETSDMTTMAKICGGSHYSYLADQVLPE